MSENPEKKSDAFQSDAFQAESAAPEPPAQLHATSLLNSLRRAAAWIRGAILRLLPFFARVPRRVTAGIAAVLILFGAAREWRTPPLPINSPPPRVLGWIWWTTPRQLYAERTLPAFDHANIQSVEVVPGRSRVWIAGDAGLLAYSDDDGTIWTTFHYDPLTGTMVKDAPVAVTTLSPLITWQVGAARLQAQQGPNTQVQLPEANKPFNSAAIHGTVTDQEGATISGANVALTNVAAKYNSTVQTEADGTYNFPYLQPGTYSLRVTRSGFVTFVENGIALSPRQSLVIPVMLSVSAVSQTVTVQAEVPARQVQTTTRPKKGGPRVQQTGEQTRPKGLPNWVNLDFFAAGTILVSSGGAYVLYTPAAGATWTSHIPSSISYPAVRGPGRYVNLYSNVRGSTDTSDIASHAGFLFRDGAEVWSQGSNHQLVSRDKPPSSLVRRAPVKAQIYGIAGAELNQAWAAGNEADEVPVIYHSGDKGQIWALQYASSESVYPQWQGVKFMLRDIAFREDGKTGFAAGTQGAILRTRDGGQHWEPITRGAAAPGKSSTDYRWWQQPVRVPAPLSLLVFLLALVFLVPVAMPEVVPRAPAERSIANLAVSDAPVFLAEKDELGFTPVARAIAGLLRNKATGLPLTVAITAPWGRGKTSLMSLVQQELKASGWRTVWFNAWHHQEETSMLASLLQTVRQKAPPELLMRGGVPYRVRLLAKRLWRWRTLWVMVGVAALFLCEKVVHDHNPHMYVNGAQYLYGVVSGGSSAGEKPGAAARPAEKPGVLQVGAQMLLDLAKSSKETGPGHLIPFAVLVSFLFLLTLQVLQSFGANPAELLAKTSDRKTVAGLEAQTIFLEKFRKQYGEVVSALGKYRLAVFVDDLDRCRPDKIAEMLEAANYLMAAGPCALVLALEEHAVIAGLALSFQRMAEEMGKLPENRKSAVGDLLGEAREKREGFAKNYVEKLFNVVVPTPPVATDSFAQLLAGRGALQMKLRERERRRRQLRRAADLVRVPAAAMVLSVLLFVGHGLLRSWLPPTETQTATRQNPPLTAPRAPSGNAVSPLATTGATTSSASVTQAIPPSYAAAEMPIPRAWFETWWQRVLWSLLTLSIVVSLSLRRPPPLVKDSPDFEDALRIWAPVLAEVNHSPRFGKRVLNRVRYLAMLEREAAKESDGNVMAIPESLLVALGAIDVAAPGTLVSESAFRVFRTLGVTQTVEPRETILQLTWSTHQSRFGVIPEDKLSEYRQRFADLSAGIVAR